MHFLRLRNYKIDDREFLFSLRNKSYVVNNSISRRKIDRLEHYNWFKKLKHSKSQIKIIINNKKKIGMVRIDQKNAAFNLSWAILKSYQGKGFGLFALKKCTVKKKLLYKCQILKTNKPSIIIALKAGFNIDKIENKIIYLKKMH